MRHKQPGFPSKELSSKQGDAGFGQKKTETLETFRRALRSGEHDSEGALSQETIPGVRVTPRGLLQMPVLGGRSVLSCALCHFSSTD